MREMLNQSARTSPHREVSIARQSKKTARQRTYRMRQAHGEFCAPVPINAAILNFLTRNRWLNEADACERKKVGEAVRSLLELSAKI
jgi:hypothetical protein